MLDISTTSAADAEFTSGRQDAAVPTAILLNRLRDQHRCGADGRCLTCHPGACPGQRATLYLAACDNGSAWTGLPPTTPLGPPPTGTPQ